MGMHTFPTFALLLVLALVAGSGCMGSDAALRLAATKACPVAALQATGSTDCDSRTPLHQELLGSVPPGWRCDIGKTFNPRATLQYYHDDQNHYGFWFDWSDYVEPVLGVGRAVLTSAGRTDIVDFGPTTRGFVRFPAAYSNGTVHIVTYGFAAEGNPAFLGTRNLTVLQLDNAQGPVYLLRFAGPDGSAYFFAEPTYHPNGAPGLKWGPSNVLQHGPDYSVTMRYHVGIETEHRFDFRNQDPLAMLRPGPDC
ncbi:MAG TPA: hypothetical protein VM241_07610 [Candidatus Thermoplasmatota archaeon]|nr:hypothetical protein [Candidatus Thermoplasmatota archaeon]